MTCPRDNVIAAFKTVFPDRDATAILAVVDLYGTAPHEPEVDRVRLVIVERSEVDEERLKYLAQVAKVDHTRRAGVEAIWPPLARAGREAAKGSPADCWTSGGKSSIPSMEWPGNKNAEQGGIENDTMPNRAGRRLHEMSGSHSLSPENRHR